METRIVNLPRRRYSAEFKKEVVLACCEANVSIARVALHHGLNANLLRRWVVEHGVTPGNRKARQGGDEPSPAVPEFVPVPIPPQTALPLRPIHIEVHRGNATVKIEWPLQATADCAAWLRDWLK
jgi:transposase